MRKLTIGRTVLSFLLIMALLLAVSARALAQVYSDWMEEPREYAGACSPLPLLDNEGSHLHVTAALALPSDPNPDIPSALEASDDNTPLPPLELDETSVIVYSYEQLIAMLETDNGYEIIYLGANITGGMDSILIHHSKAAVVIDGRPPGIMVNYTFLQYDLDSKNSVIRLDEGNTSTKSITLRNFKVDGANFEGVVFVPEAVSGVTVLFQNMIYTGPQAVTNRSGTVRLIDCTFTMQASENSELEELAEANHVEMGGKIFISSSDFVSLLWLTNDDSRFCVLEHANVEIKVEGYFLYTDDIAPDIKILDGAIFKIECQSGFTQLGANVKNFFIAPDANVFITQNASLTQASLRVEDVFEMQSNSILLIVRPNVPGTALYFPKSGGKAIFQNPKRALLYSRGYPSIGFETDGTLEISSTSINVWQDIAPEFGPPTHIWNDTNGELFSLKAYYEEGLLRELTHTLNENAPILSALDAEAFNYTFTALLTFGNLELQVQPLYAASPIISGRTDGGAAISIRYTAIGGQAIEISGSADADGFFSLPLEAGTLDAKTIVLVESAIGSLSIRDVVTPIELPPEQLKLVAVPSSISFVGTRSSDVSTVVPRNEEAFFISVIDTRANRSAWHIDVSLSAPLTATLPGATHVLPNALVFIDKNGTETPLTTEPFTIYSESSARFGQFDVAWDMTEGIMLRVNSGIAYRNVPYNTTIQWSLIDGP